MDKSLSRGIDSATMHLALLLAPERATDIASAHLAAIPELEGILGAWVSLIEAGMSSTSALMGEAAARLWIMVDAACQERPVTEIADSREGWAFVYFLSIWLASGLARPASLVRSRLLQLVRAAPEHLNLCAEVLQTKHWGDLWPDFVDLIWKNAGGGDGPDPVAARRAVVALFGRFTEPSVGRGVELPPELGFLLDHTLLAVQDESLSVANRAAYNIVRYAALARSPVDLRRIGDILGRLARDPRVEVRGAAAYAGKVLQLWDGVAEEIRAVASKIDEELASDTYAVIHRQRVFGELDGKYPPD